MTTDIISSIPDYIKVKKQILEKILGTKEISYLPNTGNFFVRCLRAIELGKMDKLIEQGFFVRAVYAFSEYEISVLVQMKISTIVDDLE